MTSVERTETVTVGRGRAAAVASALDHAALDGSVVVLTGSVNDLFVAEGGALIRLVPCVAVWGARRGMPTLTFSPGVGLRPVDAPGGPHARPARSIDPATPMDAALGAITDSVQRGGQPTVVVLDYAENVVPGSSAPGDANDGALRFIERVAATTHDPAWRGAGHRLVVIGRTGELDQRLSGLPGIRSVHLAPPAEAERRAALDRLCSSNRHALRLVDGLTVEAAAVLTGGMSLDQLGRIRDVTSPANPLTKRWIVEEKKVAIRRAAGDTLTVLDELLDLDEDVAGLPQVRWFLREHQARGSRSVRVLLAGPPGVGKTRVATAIASWLGVPALEFGAVLGPYVGESEGNMDRALEANEANCPSLTIWDEAELTGMGARDASDGNDGGARVAANLRAAALRWLGDNGDDRGISVVAQTNWPQRIDPAFRDRLTVIPILPPSPAEAAQIMAIQARRNGIVFDAEGAALVLAAATGAISGRQAVRLLEKAHGHACLQGSREVTAEDVAAAVAESMQLIGREEELQSLLAVEATTWSSMLPWNAAPMMGVPAAEPPDFLAPMVTADGSIDRIALRERIRELERQG